MCAGCRAPRALARARPRGHRHRVRRHRHEPAVHDEHGIRSGQRPATGTGECHRSSVGHRVVAAGRGVAEVRDADHACQQPWRGRHHGATRAGCLGGGGPAPASPWAADRRCVRRCAFLRGQRDHACHFGARCGRGLGDCGPATQDVRRADRARGPHRALHRAKTRDRGHRCGLRAHHGALVHGTGCRRRAQHSEVAGHPDGAEPVCRTCLPDPAWLARFRRAGLGGAGADRRRGAVRGHGAFRRPTDPRILVRPRIPGAWP